MPLFFVKRFVFFFCLVFGAGCSLLATRPVQEMSLAASALRAAHEVQADTLAPGFFRQASDWFEQAKIEYRFKNFDLAKKYADQSRVLAEKAELGALLKGAVRAEESIQDPLGYGGPKAPEPPEDHKVVSQEPYPYPSPTPTSAVELEQTQPSGLNAANNPGNMNPNAGVSSPIGGGNAPNAGATSPSGGLGSLLNGLGSSIPKP
jgi:hypothetical protein